MAQLYPVEVRLTQEEVGALDQACSGLLATMVARSYSTLSPVRPPALLDAGVLEITEAAEPDFVQHYREMEALHSATGASPLEQPTSLDSV